VFALVSANDHRLTVLHQIEVIEDMNATADPTANFKLVIVQTELERFKFLVRSLLRARIAKVSIFLQMPGKNRID
jgi:GINS complex subunit 4